MRRGAHWWWFVLPLTLACDPAPQHTEPGAAVDAMHEARQLLARTREASAAELTRAERSLQEHRATGGTAEGERQDLLFGLREARYRRSLRDEDRKAALELAAASPRLGCAAKIAAAMLGAEEHGIAAGVAALQRTARDADLDGDGTCRGQVEQRLRALGEPLAPSEASQGPVRLREIEPFYDEDGARIVLLLEGVPGGESAFSVTDDRLSEGTSTTVHIPGALARGVPRMLEGRGLVTSVQTAEVSDGVAVSFKLARAGFRRIYALPEPPRIVVDFARTAPEPRATRPLRTVVLDPGHGGVDPGALSHGGVQEKTVALDVAKRVARRLVQQQLRVTLTRERDQSVALDRRAAIANALDADLFVSIHCNAAESTAGRGVETYVLDDAREDLARRVAARENGGSETGVVTLARLLANTRFRDHADRSHHFADLLQRHAVQTLRRDYRDVRDGGVHPSAFAVLVGARMPAVLFETSYLSNVEEARRLDTPAYRELLAEGIANAVLAYRDGQ